MYCGASGLENKKSYLKVIVKNQIKEAWRLYPFQVMNDLVGNPYKSRKFTYKIKGCIYYKKDLKVLEKLCKV